MKNYCGAAIGNVYYGAQTTANMTYVDPYSLDSHSDVNDSNFLRWYLVGSVFAGKTMTFKWDTFTVSSTNGTGYVRFRVRIITTTSDTYVTTLDNYSTLGVSSVSVVVPANCTEVRFYFQVYGAVSGTNTVYMSLRNANFYATDETKNMLQTLLTAIGYNGNYKTLVQLDDAFSAHWTAATANDWVWVHVNHNVIPEIIAGGKAYFGFTGLFGYDADNPISLMVATYDADSNQIDAVSLSSVDYERQGEIEGSIDVTAECEFIFVAIEIPAGIFPRKIFYEGLYLSDTSYIAEDHTYISDCSTDKKYAADSITGTISIKGGNNSGEAMLFQWYQSDVNRNGTIITGATSSVYTLPTNLAVGTYYYYCKAYTATLVGIRSRLICIVIKETSQLTGLSIKKLLKENLPSITASDSLIFAFNAETNEVLLHISKNNGSVVKVGRKAFASNEVNDRAFVTRDQLFEVLNKMLVQKSQEAYKSLIVTQEGTFTPSERAVANPYYLTTIPRETAEGYPIKITSKLIAGDEFTKPTQSVLTWCQDKDHLVTINGGIFDPGTTSDTYELANGIIVSNGEILSDKYVWSGPSVDLTNNIYSLCINADGDLFAKKYVGNSAADLINEGFTEIATGFYPLYIDGYKVCVDYITASKTSIAGRHLIGQFFDGTYFLLYFRDGGSGVEYQGVSLYEVWEFVDKNLPNVKFLYNLDGGSSTSAVLYRDWIYAQGGRVVPHVLCFDVVFPETAFDLDALSTLCSGLTESIASKYPAEAGALLETAVAGKVNAIEGKGLSTNDYTTEEKTALAKIVRDGGFVYNSLEW